MEQTTTENIGGGDGPAPTRVRHAVKAMQTRFLYPFFFRRNAVGEAMNKLQTATIAKESISWVLGPCSSLYVDEMLPHVAEFLFPEKGVAGCGYMKLTDALLNKLLQDVELWTPKVVMPVKAVHTTGCELFLSPQGVGVLSLTLTLADGFPLTEELVQQFNYFMVRHTKYSRACLRIKHPQDDPERFQRLRQEDRDRIGPVPDRSAPIASRLGARGGELTPIELVNAILAPLDVLERRNVQDTLSLYTIVCYEHQTTFGAPADRAPFGWFVAALAQAEEPNHPGAPDDDLGVSSLVLNQKHWAAVGQSGAAHLVANQIDAEGKPLAFNAERIARVRDKYFMAYLLGLMQRLSLHRALADASEITSHGVGPRSVAGWLNPHPANATDGSSASHSGTKAVTASQAGPAATRLHLVELRDSLLEFALGGHFTQMSMRHAVHRFYQLVRDGLDVQQAWQEVRRAISDMEGKHSIANERETSENMAGNIKIVARTQQKVETIECFIISVYFAELAHICFEAAAETIHLVTVLVVAFVVLFVAWRYLKAEER